MAKKIVCDICGGECRESGSYEFIHRVFWSGSESADICYKCIRIIKNAIKGRDNIMEDKALDKIREEFIENLQIYKEEWQKASDKINPSMMGYWCGKVDTMRYVIEGLNKINNC